jgi:hypothetical protein
LDRSHVSHRIGKDVDIEFVASPDKLIEIFRNKGWVFIEEGENNYPHFRLEN